MRKRLFIVVHHFISFFIFRQTKNFNELLVLAVSQVIIWFITKQQSVVLLYNGESEFAEKVIKQSNDFDGYEILNDGQHALIHRTNVD